MNVRAIKNGIWNALASATGTLTGIAGSILIVRSLTREAYGTFSYYMWLASVLGILGTLAFPHAVTKITSELTGNKQQLEAEVLSRWVSLWLVGINLLLSISLIGWAYSASTSERIYLFIVAVTFVPNALTGVLSSTFWGRERYKPVSIVVFAASLLQLAFIVVAYFSNWGTPGFLAALLSINIFQAIGLALVFQYPFNRERQFPGFLHIPPTAVIRRYLAFAAPATLVLLYEVVVWQRSEVFFLKWLSNIEQVGFYSLAYTVFGTLLALGWALINGFYPAISRDYGAREWFRIQEKVSQGLILATLFSVPFTFGGWATLHSLVVLLYTPKMLPSVPVAQVLLAGLLPGVVTAMLSISVNAIGGIWLQVRLGVVLAAVNVGLDLVLIPRFGAMGGAIANTTAQFAYTVLLVAIVQQRYKLKLPWRSMISIAAVGAFTTFVMPMVAQAWLPGVMGLIGTIGLTGGIYVMAVWGLGYLQPLRTTSAAS